MNSIPVIDIAPLVNGSPDQAQAVAMTLGSACREVGFFYVSGHGIPPELIARAFDLRNADRAALKTMLRELAAEGRVEQRRKKLHHPGTLPHVVVADVTARDRDGELIADSTPAQLRAGGRSDDLEEAFLNLVRAHEQVSVSGQGREHRSEARARSGAPRGSERGARA